MDVDDRDPSKLLSSKESTQNFWDLTEQLKPNQREMLWLRYGEGFSIGEIAEIMNTNPVFVRVNLHRARNYLVKSMEQKSEFQ
jgi:RNA polymerase sigma factor (sigma-70 family)